MNGNVCPEVDVVEADDVAVVDADEKVTGQLLRHDAQGDGNGDTFPVAEIQVAITSARLHIQEATAW